MTCQLLLLCLALGQTTSSAPATSEAPKQPPRLEVAVGWPEQELQTNTVHKLRIPRGGKVEVVATIEPNGVDLRDSQVELTCTPAAEVVGLAIAGEKAEPAWTATVGLSRRKEIRWTVQLPWQVRQAEKEYRFEVSVARPQRRGRGGRPAGYSAAMKASVTVEQGVCCWDTTAEARLEELARNEHCKLEKIGSSALGREMYLLRVSDWSAPDAGKKQMIIVGPYHGDEPAGAEACLDFAYELATKPENEDYLRKVVFYMIPSHNPDGHESAQHWGTHDVDPGNHAYEKMEIPEARAVAGALRKYADRLKNAVALVHHQWPRDYTLISHMDLLPAEECPSWRLVQNMSIDVSNQLDIPMFPLYGRYTEKTFTGVRGMLSAEMGIPNFTVEDRGHSLYNLADAMPNVNRELAIYYATMDQLLAPHDVAPKVHPPRKDLTFPADRNCQAWKVDSPPAIDGRLDEPCWRGDTAIRDFVSMQRGAGQVQGNSAYVAYDDGCIYIAFKAAGLKPAKAAADAAPDASSGASDDSSANQEPAADGCEIMLDTNLNQWTYFHLIVKADGTFADAYFRAAGISDGGEYKIAGAKAAVSVEDGAVELSVPLAAFNYPGLSDPPIPLPIADGTVWGANFVRMAHDDTPEASWAKVTNQYTHRPWEFNAITFMGKRPGQPASVKGGQ